MPLAIIRKRGTHSPGWNLSIHRVTPSFKKYSSEIPPEVKESRNNYCLIYVFFWRLNIGFILGLKYFWLFSDIYISGFWIPTWWLGCTLQCDITIVFSCCVAVFQHVETVFFSQVFFTKISCLELIQELVFTGNLPCQNVAKVTFFLQLILYF